MTSQLTLFTVDAGLEARFAIAFSGWVESRSRTAVGTKGQRAFRKGSIQVYESMWGVLTGWCTKHARSLATLDEADLAQFLDSLGAGTGATDRYRQRMLRLIERVDLWESRQAQRPPNPAISKLAASPALRFAGSRHQDPLIEYLTSSQARALVNYITAEIDAGPVASTWKALRDRCAIGLQLGGGIAPGECRELLTSSILTDGGKRRGVPWGLSTLR